MRKTALALVVLTALGAWAYWIWQNQQQARPVDSASGTIECDEIHIASRYGGRVVKISAREGDLLTNGQPIVELTAPELLALRAEAAALLADLEAGARPEEIAAAKNEWEAGVAELQLAQSDAKRALDLFARQIIPENERERAVTHASALEKSVVAARSRYDLLLAGTRPGRIEQARATLRRIDSQIAELRVGSPTDCVLEVLNVKVGDVVAANRDLATLILTGRLWIRVYVAQPQLGALKVGQAVQFRADAFGAKSFHGEIEQINRAAEFTPRNVQTAEERVKRVFGVKVRLPADSGELRPGMTGDVIF